MNIAALFLNGMKKETKMWEFQGEFSANEKNKFDSLLSKYEPKTRPGGGWNYWIIYKDGGGPIYELTRFTWENGWHGSFDEIKDSYTTYQTRFDK